MNFAASVVLVLAQAWVCSRGPCPSGRRADGHCITDHWLFKEMYWVLMDHYRCIWVLCSLTKAALLYDLQGEAAAEAANLAHNKSQAVAMASFLRYA
jgi:hypothetical protein